MGKPTLSMGKQYSSVSEAFSGDFADDEAPNTGDDEDLRGQEYVEESGRETEQGRELFIVEEGKFRPVQTAWTTANGHSGQR